MLFARARFWGLAVLLLVYLAGILVLSIVSLHESKHASYSKGRTYSSGPQRSNLRSLEYGNFGSRYNFPRSQLIWCRGLTYLNPPRDVTALASFPGSGNTWLRYLLQQATGIYTGSVYRDYGLLKNGFPAEGVLNGSVLVVKTHEWGRIERNKFAKAILLVRSPGPAIQAEFNRQNGGHIGLATPDRYRRTKGQHWQHFFNVKLKDWQQMNLDWLYNFTGPTHVIFYEQLVDNVEHTLKTIMDFIQAPTDYELFKCAIEHKEGIYKRRKRFSFDPFSPKMKEKLRIAQERIYNAIYKFASPATTR